MPEQRVGAIILAAGPSSRLGTPKQLLHFRGQSLLRRAALSALGAGCRPVVVVTGAHAQLYVGELDDLAVLAAFNREWQEGLASSIRTGIEALVSEDPDVTAALILLCDQPHVTSALLSRLIGAHLATGCLVVASTYGDSAGAPALFSRSLFAELGRLEGASGAKHVIARHAAEAHLVPFPDGEADVDTPADVERLGLSPAVGSP